MNELRNYNVYIKGMNKGFEEKLFFLDKLDLNDFDTVIDFGCGAGEVLHAIAESEGMFPRLRLIGIDLDDYMRELTLRRTPNIEVYPELKRDMITDKTLIIFNSVLHEVGSYWIQLRKMLVGTGATLAIRDMRFDSHYNSYVSRKDMAKVVARSAPSQLSEFIAKYGMLHTQDLYHYLLKYTYVDNWKLELEENYFSFDWYDMNIIGSIVYEELYTLEFKREQVKEEFGIDLTAPTHCKMIVRLDKED